jgi:hypothetical protein
MTLDPFALRGACDEAIAITIVRFKTQLAPQSRGFFLVYLFYKEYAMENPEKILELHNEFEAELIEEILKDRNIPFLIRKFHDSAYDGLWESQSGWGNLMAPPEYKDEILKIYEEMANSSFDGSKDLEG